MAWQGLDTLKELRDLNLSGNTIESIGHSWSNLPQLEVLRLSGNRLTSLQVLTHTHTAAALTHYTGYFMFHRSWLNCVHSVSCTLYLCVTPPTPQTQSADSATILPMPSITCHTYSGSTTGRSKVTSFNRSFRD